MAMATAELPEELITEILTRLPVKSIKRFRSLSKPLSARINSPQFMDSHFSKSSQNFNLRKLIFQEPSRKKFHVCNLNLNKEQEVLRLENASTRRPRNLPLELVYGYCKGLLLLYRGKFRFSVWNPSTRQCRNLPQIPLNPSNGVIIGHGLGYDHSIHDYKVFSIIYLFRPNIDIQVWICGLKSNTWRMSQKWNFPRLLLCQRVADYRFPGTGCFTPVDGIMHWLCTPYCHIPVIVAFDVRKETFTFLSTPDCFLNSDSVERYIHYPFSTTLHVLEGCLCISYVSTMPLQADLYIRRKEGDRFAWTQLFSVTKRLFDDKIWFKTVHVLGYLKRGDKIMLDLGMDYLVSFDLKAKTFGKVQMDKDSNWKDPIPFVESLVPLS